MTATNEHTGDRIAAVKGDKRKIADNWPWPDPFEQRMAERRKREQALADSPGSKRLK